MSPATGKILIIAGLIVAVLGVLVYFFGDKAGFLGRLPGDIRISGPRGSFYFPLTTCILLSIVLTILVKLIQWLQR